MKTIRWGMIGCGDVAEVKSGPGFQNADGSELVAVMRRRGDLAADFARRHGVRASYDNAAALINDPAVDAVYVATPPGAHEELALAVCAARKPAYVEKPMARTHAECQRMIDAGLEIHFISDAVLIHKEHASTMQAQRLASQIYFDDLIAFTRKWYGALAALALKLLVIPTRTAMDIVQRRRGERDKF